jgi:hypothetical protein
MANVTIEDGQLRVELEGMHKVWALKNTISVPVSHIVSASAGPIAEADSPTGIRAPGTHIPGVFAAGTWHHKGEKVFWDVRDPSNVVVIELRDESYSRLILEVDDPRATVDLITAQMDS